MAVCVTALPRSLALPSMEAPFAPQTRQEVLPMINRSLFCCLAQLLFAVVPVTVAAQQLPVDIDASSLARVP